MDAIQLQKIYDNAMLKTTTNIKHLSFLNRLKVSSDNFQKDLEEEIIEKLKTIAEKSKKSCKFKSKYNFSEKYGNVKVSTLVKGWKTENGWDIERFYEIGLDSTPFENLVKNLEKRGIFIKNISDSKKGFGFWIEASF
jgi:hypothetical protein